MMVPKFRAWDKNTKEYFHISELWNSGTNPEYFNFDGWKDNFGNKGRLKNIVIEQFTGLTDVYGEEIYEGDVVKTDQHGYNQPDSYVVKEFIQNVCVFRSALVTDGSTMFEEATNGHDLTLIGNIHENMELLGVEK